MPHVTSSETRSKILVPKKTLFRRKNPMKPRGNVWKWILFHIFCPPQKGARHFWRTWLTRKLLSTLMKWIIKLILGQRKLKFIRFDLNTSFISSCNSYASSCLSLPENLSNHSFAHSIVLAETWWKNIKNHGLQISKFCAVHNLLEEKVLLIMHSVICTNQFW